MRQRGGGDTAFIFVVCITCICIILVVASFIYLKESL